MKAEIELWGDRLVAALFDGGYQGLVVVAVIWAALKCLPRANAATRYAAWMGTLAVVVALPIAHLISSRARPEPKVVAMVPTEVPVEEMPLVEFTLEESSEPLPVPVAKTWSLSVPKQTSVVLAATWILLALVRLSYLGWQIAFLNSLKKRAIWAGGPAQASFEAISRDMGLKRGARLLKSAEIDVPMVVGFFRPVVLLPAKLGAGPLGIEQLLRHELAHVARRDDWANLFQQAVGAVLFFYPSVWFLSRRLTVEREIACDDHALTALGAAKDYALFLTEFAGRARGRDWSAAPAAWSSKSQLKERIGMILDGKRNASPRLAGGRVLGVTVTAVLLALLALEVGPRLVLAAEDPEATPAKAKPEYQLEGPAIAINPTPPAIAISAPAPMLAVTAKPPAPVVKVSPMPMVAPPVLAAVPPVGPAPGPRRREDDSLERRLDRLERMVESMMERQRSGNRNEPTPRPPAFGKPNERDEWGNIREEVRRERERAMREVERANHEAERAAREVAKAHQEMERGRMEVDRNREFQNQSLKARRQSLEQQKRSIEKQIEAVEKQMESQERHENQERQAKQEKQEKQDKQDKEKEKSKKPADNEAVRK